MGYGIAFPVVTPECEEITEYDATRRMFHVNQMAISGDGRYALVAGGINVEAGRSLLYDLQAAPEEPRYVDDTPRRLIDIGLSPNGQIAMTAADDGIVRIWDTSDSTVIAQVDQQHATYISAAFSRDGRQLATLDRSTMELSIWRVPDSIRELGGWQASDPANFSLEFDGEDDYVDIPSLRL